MNAEGTILVISGTIHLACSGVKYIGLKVGDSNGTTIAFTGLKANDLIEIATNNNDVSSSTPPESVPTDAYNAKISSTTGVYTHNYDNTRHAYYNKYNITVSSDGDVSFKVAQNCYIAYIKVLRQSYTVTLNNQSATSAGTESVTVTYDASTNLTTNITCPTKESNTFGGYYTEENGAGTQLINSEGVWIASVDGYTDSDKKWIHDGDVTLYAKWTSSTPATTQYTITNNTGALGTVSWKVGEETESSSSSSIDENSKVTLTATPNEGYAFDKWSIM